LLLVRSDITKSNYDKVLSCIKKEIKAMKKVSLESLTDAINFYKMSCYEGMEEPRDIVDNYYKHILVGSHLLEEKLKDVEKVSVDDVQNIVDKLHIHTIHLFGGGDTK
jgi:predicted Zn-dependent peptidase